MIIEIVFSNISKTLLHVDLILISCLKTFGIKEINCWSISLVLADAKIVDEKPKINKYLLKTSLKSNAFFLVKLFINLYDKINAYDEIKRKTIILIM